VSTNSQGDYEAACSPDNADFGCCPQFIGDGDVGNWWRASHLFMEHACISHRVPRWIRGPIDVVKWIGDCAPVTELSTFDLWLVSNVDHPWSCDSRFRAPLSGAGCVISVPCVVNVYHQNPHHIHPLDRVLAKCIVTAAITLNDHGYHYWFRGLDDLAGDDCGNHLEVMFDDLLRHTAPVLLLVTGVRPPVTRPHSNLAATYTGTFTPPCGTCDLPRFNVGIHEAKSLATAAVFQTGSVAPNSGTPTHNLAPAFLEVNHLDTGVADPEPDPLPPAPAPATGTTPRKKTPMPTTAPDPDDSDDDVGYVSFVSATGAQPASPPSAASPLTPAGTKTPRPSHSASPLPTAGTKTPLPPSTASPSKTYSKTPHASPHTATKTPHPSNAASPPPTTRTKTPHPLGAASAPSNSGAKSPHPRSAASPLPTAGTKIPLPQHAASPPSNAGTKVPHASNAAPPPPQAGTKVPHASNAAPPPPQAGAKVPHASNAAPPPPQAGAKVPHASNAAPPPPQAGAKVPHPSNAAPPPPHAGAKVPHPSGTHAPGTHIPSGLSGALQAVTLNPSSILDGLDGSSAAAAQTLPDLVYSTMKAEDLLPPYLPNGHRVYTHWSVGTASIKPLIGAFLEGMSGFVNADAVLRTQLWQTFIAFPTALLGVERRHNARDLRKKLATRDTRTIVERAFEEALDEMEDPTPLPDTVPYVAGRLVKKEHKQRPPRDHNSRAVRQAIVKCRAGEPGAALNGLIRDAEARAVALPKMELDKMISILTKLHPTGANPPKLPPSRRLYITGDEFHKFANRLAKGKAPGVSGWSEDLLSQISLDPRAADILALMVMDDLQQRRLPRTCRGRR
jgi:hypothetical protein